MREGGDAEGGDAEGGDAEGGGGEMESRTKRRVGGRAQSWSTLSSDVQASEASSGSRLEYFSWSRSPTSLMACSAWPSNTGRDQRATSVTDQGKMLRWLKRTHAHTHTNTHVRTHTQTHARTKLEVAQTKSSDMSC